MIVEEDIESDEDAGAIVADHQDIAEQYDQHEDESDGDLVLQVVDYLGLVFEFLQPEQDAGDQLEEVYVVVVVYQRECVYCQDYYIDGELGSQVFAFYHVPIIDHFSLSEGIVPLEEIEEQIDAKIQDYNDINRPIKTLGLQLILKEMRSKSQRECNLQFYDIEYKEKEKIPNQCEGG